jgi:hypothetical protein
MTQLKQTIDFLTHLRTTAEPFRVRRADRQPLASDLPLHTASRVLDPELYALSAVAQRVQPAQRARVLYNLLAHTRRGLAPDVIAILDRVTVYLLHALPPDTILGVFLALRRARANHKHAARTVTRFLLNNPRAAGLIDRRRAAVRDALEHALGRNVARGCAKFLLAGAGPSDSYVRKHLLKFATNPARAVDALLSLYGGAPFVAIAANVDLAPFDEPIPQRPRTITATNRGDIAATLVHLYHGGGVPNAQFTAALDDYVARAAAGLPRFAGRVALVVDASASTRGYGEREFAAASQIQALRLVLRACCQNLSVFTTGGDGGATGLPFPQGDTDLASALLDALEHDPDLVAVVSDGYENVALGDLARVVVTLPRLHGLTTPVVFCHCKFTDQDDLSLRRPLPPGKVEQLEFWHQDDFADLLWSLFSQARGDRGRDVLRTFLRDRLARVEKEYVHHA